MNNDNDSRVTPRSELDLNLMTTNSVWGSGEISESLKEKLTKYFEYKDEKGNVKVAKQEMWGLLSFYTRDMRMSNLSVSRGEVAYCQYYLDLANDFLQADYIEPFLICLSRVATVLELSQSKGGFLRKMNNTLRQENITGELEPKKKTFMGKSGREE